MGLVLLVAGVALLALGLVTVRQPLARLRSLRATQANLARYDDWRGARLRPEPGEKTGADLMLDVLRRTVIIRGAIAGAGAILILAGLLVR
ncbi:MAG: hypothetical protein ACKOTZ_07740 [Chloroflexota bacterium]